MCLLCRDNVGLAFDAVHLCGCGVWDLAGLEIPDVVGVLFDGPIAGEFTHSESIVNRHLGPLFALILVDYLSIVHLGNVVIEVVG